MRSVTYPFGAVPEQQPIVDASVHVFFKHNDEIRDWLREPWRSRGVSQVEMGWYSAPEGEYDPEIAAATDGYPGADPRQVGRHLFEERGVDVAILHPLGRGIIPDLTVELKRSDLLAGRDTQLQAAIDHLKPKQ